MLAPPRPERWSPSSAIRLSCGLQAVAVAGAALSPASWPWLLGGVAANHLLLGAAGMWPRSRVLGPNLDRLSPASAARGQVALTFDDGPDPTVTPRVLDLLDRASMKATFFCIGRRAVAYPALVREIVLRGHAVENHSDRHSNAFACYLPSALHAEIARAQVSIADISGRAPRFFRAPMGLRSPFLDPVLHRLGLRLVSWTRRGYDVVCRDPRAVLGRLTARLDAGDVLVLHDGNSACTQLGEPVILALLPDLLARLADAGLSSVTLAACLPVAAEPAGPADAAESPAAGGYACR